jgi:hypothetical protein
MRYAGFFQVTAGSLQRRKPMESCHLLKGWAIAVSALALSGKITANHKIAGDFLYDYIKTQIWDKFDEKLRLFLLKTSIVDEFTLRLAEHLSQMSDAQHILDSLCATIYSSADRMTYIVITICFWIFYGQRPGKTRQLSATTFIRPPQSIILKKACISTLCVIT